MKLYNHRYLWYQFGWHRLYCDFWKRCMAT